MGAPVRSRHPRLLAVPLLVPLLLAAAPLVFEPAFRVAAPPGWMVDEGKESNYAWLRFVESAKLDGEDFRGQAITLYRFELNDPEEAGEALARAKISEQKISKRSQVQREAAGVRWKGFEAAYVSESGVSRREIYLYAKGGKKLLYLFWARGPAAGWETKAALCEAALAKISAVISGKGPTAGGEGKR
jgi:hypothetical protein